MCIPTDKGYRMADGVEITHDQIIKGQISNEHLDELRASSMNSLDGVHIRNNLHELRKDLQNMVLVINSSEILNPIIDARLKENTKTMLFSTAKVIGAFSIIIGIFWKIYDWLLPK